MPKLVSLRVVVSADDTVQTADVTERLRGKFEAMETEAVDQETPRSRIYWCSAEVLQGSDRAPGTRSTITPSYKQRRGRKPGRRTKRETEAAAPLPA